MKLQLLFLMLAMGHGAWTAEGEFEEVSKDPKVEDNRDLEEERKQEAQKEAAEKEGLDGDVEGEQQADSSNPEEVDDGFVEERSGGLSFADALSANRSARSEFSMENVSDVLEKQKAFVDRATLDLKSQLRFQRVDTVAAERAQTSMKDLYQDFWGEPIDMDQVMDKMSELESYLDSQPMNPRPDSIEVIEKAAKRLGIDINDPQFKVDRSLIDSRTGKVVVKAGEIDWQKVSSEALSKLRDSFYDYNSVYKNHNVMRLVTFEGELSALKPEYQQLQERWEAFKAQGGDMTSAEAQKIVDELATLGARLSKTSSQIDVFYDGVSGKHKYKSVDFDQMKKYMRKSWFTSAKEWVADFINAIRGKYPSVKQGKIADPALGDLEGDAIIGTTPDIMKQSAGDMFEA